MIGPDFQILGSRTSCVLDFLIGHVSNECGSNAHWLLQLPFLPAVCGDGYRFCFTPTSSPHMPLTCQSHHSHL